MIKRRRNKLEGERKFNQEGRGAFLVSIKGKIALMGGDCNCGFCCSRLCRDECFE